MRDKVTPTGLIIEAGGKTGWQGPALLPHGASIVAASTPEAYDAMVRLMGAGRPVALVDAEAYERLLASHAELLSMASFVADWLRARRFRHNPFGDKFTAGLTAAIERAKETNE